METGMDTFHSEMQRLKVRALWEMDSHGNRRGEVEQSMIWRWKELQPLIDQAVAAANMEDTERRVLAFYNPDLEGASNAISSLNGALQILLPGEHARPHRHSMNALRFVMEGSGATTIVEGKRCPMAEGDLILTPSWTWHEHVHEGTERIVWFDSLDVPLHQFFKTSAFEAGPPKNVLAIRDDEEFSTAGMVPANAAASSNPTFSPMFRYSWADACAAVAKIPADEDGSRMLRYINPLTGGAVMSMIDCYLQELARGQETVPRRSSSSTIYLVAEGEGESTVGDSKIKWSRNDVFTVPRKNWHTHRATSRSAKLFLASDREVLQKLGLLQEEVGR